MRDFRNGMPATNADQINADLLTFFKGAATAAPSLEEHAVLSR